MDNTTSSQGLVSLTLCNFKSYAGLHHIGPLSPFTSIIGPNGAGKSNLMDAISFVLGLSSSSLRSSTLGQLIHRPGVDDNSATDQPDDQPDPYLSMDADGNEINSAEVETFVSALYLPKDSPAVPPLILKRSISPQSGASVYSLDGRVVTYTQYIKRLEKENILVKARNFLVFQGDVEAVASQSPKELTKCIEQISGSLEYAAEYENLRQVSERATEQSTFLFNKKRAIAADLKTFQDSKNELDVYDALVAERAQVERDLSALSLRELHSRMEAIKEKLNEQSRNSSTDVNAVKAEIKECQKLIATKTKELSRIQKLKDSYSSELEDLKLGRAKLSESLKLANRRRVKASESSKKAQAEVDQITARVNSMENDLKALRASLTNSVREKASVLELSDDQVKEYNTLNDQVAVTTSETKRAIDLLKQKISSPNSSCHDLEGKMREKEDSINQLQISKNLLVSQLEDARLQLEEILETRDSIEDERRAVEKELRKNQLRENEIQEMITSVEGFLMQASVDKTESRKNRKLMDAIASLKSKFPGMVLGRVIDLCKPIHSRYDHPLSLLMGKHSDSIVVATQAEALKMIEFMKGQKLPRATLLPLDTLVPPTINERGRSMAGCRLALDAITYESQFNPVMLYVYGNDMICDDLDIARDLVFEKKMKVKAVTMDGTIIHKTGMMTGGASSTSSQKRFEESEVLKLKSKRSKLSDELAELIKSRLKNNAKQFDTANLDKQVQDMENHIETLTEQLHYNEKTSKALTSELVTLRSDYERESQILQDLEGQVEKLSRTLKTAEDRIFADFCRQVGLGCIREYSSRLAVVDSKTVALQRQTARVENQIKCQARLLADTNARLEAIQKAMASDDSSCSDLTDRIQVNNDKIHEVDQHLVECDTTSLRQEMKQVQTRLDDLQAILVNMSSERSRQVGELETELDSLVLAMDSMKQQFALQGKLTSSDVADLSSLFSNLKGKNADKLRMSLANIDASLSQGAPMGGSGNAEERLTQLQDRLKVASQEFDDSRKAAKDAKDEFQKLEKKRYDLFTNAFTHISKTIDGIYKELTQSPSFPLGGTAYLSLMDTSQPFLDGIKYHAMPPMKRFRDMELLSGGEKTVAALALLFAINSYCPSPFFILDEIDAALDATNVARVASYIAARSCTTFQCIVISLKSLFYEKAESLVGVYRTPKSSQILTLDLKSRFEE